MPGPFEGLRVLDLSEGVGGPLAALCLYSLEVIQALQAEGHSIFPGSVGENITLSHLDWSRVTPGVRLDHS